MTIRLSPDQQEVLDLVVKEPKMSLHIGGGAGHGKSELIRQIDSKLRSTPGYVKVARDGLAAASIQARTFMSEFCMTPNMLNESVDKAYAFIARNEVSASKYTGLTTVLIDEAPVLSARELDFWWGLVKRFRPADRGRNIRLILVGDFLQLSPVEGEPIFKSELWSELFDNPGGAVRGRHCELTTSHRQSERRFVYALDCMRLGFSTCAQYGIDTTVASQIVEEAKQRYEKKDPTIEPQYYINLLQTVATLEKAGKWTRQEENMLEPLVASRRYCCVDLSCRKKGVEELNLARLKVLPTTEVEFKAIDDSMYNHSDSFAKHIRAPSSVRLKIGAVVSLTINTYYSDYGLVNGSMGVVINFEKWGKTTLPVVQFFANRTRLIVQYADFKLESRGNVIFSRKQVPLELCYARTVHKAQGQTYDSVVVHSHQSFSFGHMYTAFSRVRTMSGLFLDDGGSSVEFKSNPAIIAEYKRIGLLDATLRSLKTSHDEGKQRVDRLIGRMSELGLKWTHCADHKDTLSPLPGCDVCFKQNEAVTQRVSDKEEKKPPIPIPPVSANRPVVIVGGLTDAVLHRIEQSRQRAMEQLNRKRIEEDRKTGNPLALPPDVLAKIEKNRREAIARRNKLVIEKAAKRQRLDEHTSSSLSSAVASAAASLADSDGGGGGGVDGGGGGGDGGKGSDSRPALDADGDRLMNPVNEPQPKPKRNDFLDPSFWE